VKFIDLASLSRGKFSIRFGLNLLVGLTFFAFLLFQACTEPNSLGSSTLPAGDLVIIRNSPSQRNIVSLTKTTPDVRSDEPSAQLLGAVNDPYFGMISAGFATQFVLSEVAPAFGTDPICDSVIIFFPLTNEKFGKISTPEGKIKYTIYQLSSGIIKDNSYFQNTSISNYVQQSDTIKSFELNPEDIIISAANPNNSGGIQVKLPITFGQKFLDNSASLITNAIFVDFFKGLALVPDTTGITSGNGCILNFDLLSSALKSRVSIYFHNNAQPNLRYDLNVTADCARFNFLQHNYSSQSNITSQLTDSTLGMNNVFVTSMFLQPVIYLPFIESWKDSLPLTINRAQLVIKANDLENASFDLPPKFVLYTYDPNGVFNEIPDYDLGESYFLGNYNSSAGEYRFNISVYLQEILSGKRTDKGLWLRPLNEAGSVRRVSLKGGSSMSVEMIYSKN
jgi:hypothetical protein